MVACILGAGLGVPASAQEDPGTGAIPGLIMEDPAELPLLDTDGDGTPDRDDDDIDGDGIPNWMDEFPLDSTESTDNDGDVIGDNADPDDDNDGIPDVQDRAPFTDQVGATDLKFRVDETGAATFNAPIATVAGTAGVVPTLSLGYSSRGGSGLLGRGWSIGGLSKIGRCRQSLASDGQALPITWSSDDRFCLDGEKLVVVSGSYGAPGSIYRTEIDRFLKVTAVGGTTGHPDAFKVERKDGSVSYYGRVPGEGSTEAQEKNGAGQVLNWALRRFQDSVGNPIWFLYEDGGQGHRISEVRYAYGSAAGPQGEHAKVSFTYESRPDPRHSYISGYEFVTSVRLASIESSNEGVPIREYLLTYAPAAGSPSSISRVERLEECAGGKCLPPTTFKWGPDALGSFVSTPDSYDFLTPDRTLTTHELADINGDGLLDLVWLQRDIDFEHRRNNLRYALSNGSTLQPATFANGAPEIVIDYNDEIEDFVNVIDYNADGRQDVLVFNLSTGFWDVLLSVPQPDGSWRLTTSRIATPVPFGGSNRDVYAVEVERRHTAFVDLNSDGLVDALYRLPGQQPKVRFLERDPSQPDSSSRPYRFGSEQVWAPTFAPVTTGHPRSSSSDFNGDGLSDLITPLEANYTPGYIPPYNSQEPVYQTPETFEYTAPAIFITGSGGTSASPYQEIPLGGGSSACRPGNPFGPSGDCTYTRHTATADLNGDGLTDLVYTVESGHGTIYEYSPSPLLSLYVVLSTGTGFTEPQLIGTVKEKPGLNLSYDHNRDGHPDLVWHDRAAQQLRIRLWIPATQSFGPETTLRSTSGSDQEAHLFVDTDGDGFSDYVNLDLQAGSIHTYLANNTGPLPTLTTAFTNGHGARTEITYGTLAASGHYERLTIGTPSAPTVFYFAGQPYSLPMGSPEVDMFYTMLNQGFDLPAGAQTLGKDAPVLEMMGTFPIVTRVVGAAPRAGATPGNVDPQATSAISYFYGEGKLQASGRGFLGFHKVRSVDEQTGVATTTTYRQDFPFVGKPWKTEVWTPQGALLRASTSTWELETWNGGNPTLPHHLVQREIVEETYVMLQEGGIQGGLLQKVRTRNEYDAYDNATLVVTETEDPTGVVRARKTVVNAYGPTTWDQEMGRLTRVESTQERMNPGGTETETRVSSFTYHDSGPLKGLLETETIEPDLPVFSRTKTYTYDAFGNTLETTESAYQMPDRTARVVYDPLGRYVDETYNALDQLVQKVLARDPLGQWTQAEDINGVLTTREYDAFGRVDREEHASGAWAETTRLQGASDCPGGTAYVVEIETAGAGTSRVCYDSLARETRKITPAFDGTNTWQEKEYDDQGREVFTSVPHPSYAGAAQIDWATSSYDLLDRVTTVELPDGSTQTTTYAGPVISTTNALGHTTTEVRNALGERVLVTDPDGAQVAFAYDVAGREKKITNLGSPSDPHQVEITLTYDLLGRKIAMSDPDKGHWSYEYNGFDELIEQTDGRGNVTTISYDALGRTLERVDQLWDPGTQALVEEERTQWTWDTAPNGVGQPASVSQLQSGYVETYTYDVHARPSQTTTTLGASGTYTRSVTYDAFSRIDQEHDALHAITGNSGLQHVYTATGHLSHIVDLATGDEVYRVMAQNARDQVTQERLGNGLYTDYAYDSETGRLEGQEAFQPGGIAIQDIEYVWDEVGNLVSRRNQRGGQDLQESFCYDALNRVIKVTPGTTSFACAGLPLTEQTTRYDTLGNITYKADVGAYTYGAGTAGPHAVTSTSDGITYSYDANGNMTSDSSGRSLVYTSFDKPSQISKGGHTITFAYGPERARYRRIDTPATGPATTTLYLGNVERISESGNPYVEWRRYLKGKAIYTVTTDASDQVIGTNKAFQYNDHLGSIDVLTDESGAVLQQFSFDPWGQRRNAFDWNALSPTQLVSFDHSLTTRGFTGHEMLDEVGLIHMNGRIYDPRLGRFLQADPFIQSDVDGQLYNRYSYARNNPLNVTDPSGYFLPVLAAALVFATYGAEAYVLAAVVAGAVAFAETLIRGGSFGDALIAGISSAAFVYLGGAAANGLYDPSTYVVSVSITGGVTAELQGGSFGDGFYQAGLGAVIGGALNSAAGQYIKFFKEGGGSFGVATRILTKAAIGGTTSELTGGKFKNGAASGAFVAALEEVSPSDGSTIGDSRSDEGDPAGVGDPDRRNEAVAPKIRAYEEDGVRNIELDLTYELSDPDGELPQRYIDRVEEALNVDVGEGRAIRARFGRASPGERGDLLIKVRSGGCGSAYACVDRIGGQTITVTSLGISLRSLGLGGLRPRTIVHEVLHVLGLQHRANSTGSLISYADKRTFTRVEFDALYSLYGR